MSPICLLPNEDRQTDWYAALHTIGRQPASSGLLAGVATRLLFDARQLRRVLPVLRELPGAG